MGNGMGALFGHTPKTLGHRMGHRMGHKIIDLNDKHKKNRMGHRMGHRHEEGRRGGMRGGGAALTPRRCGGVRWRQTWRVWRT